MMKIINRSNLKFTKGSIIKINKLGRKHSEYLMIVDNRYGTYCLVDLEKGVIKEHEYTLPEILSYISDNPLNQYYNSDEIQLILGDSNA